MARRRPGQERFLPGRLSIRATQTTVLRSLSHAESDASRGKRVTTSEAQVAKARRFASSPINTDSDLANADTLSSRTITPSIPSRTSARTVLPASVATTGTPHARASQIEFPKPSIHDAET